MTEKESTVPELPDVEVFRRYLNSTALHQEITGVDVEGTRVLNGVTPASLSRSLKGRSIESTSRHGKYLLAELDSGRALVLHFGMTGRLEYYKDGEPPKHARVVLEFKNGYRLAYVCQRKLGKVSLTRGREALAEERGLGPDAMEVSRGEFLERVGSKKGSVKAVLMDQSAVAGVGNIYADEVLFQAGVDPRTKVGDLVEVDLRKIYSKMKEVLKVAIKSRVDPERFPGSYLLPQRGAGGKCPGCSGELEKIRVSGRATYLCPKCQRRGGERGGG